MKHGETTPRASVLHLLKFWKTFVVVLVPLICLPLLFVDKDDEKVRKRDPLLYDTVSAWQTIPTPIAFCRTINMQPLNANAESGTRRM